MPESGPLKPLSQAEMRERSLHTQIKTILFAQQRDTQCAMWMWMFGVPLPIVWRTVVFFRNELVVAFDGEVEGGYGDGDGGEEEDGPAGGAEGPREVEVPAGPEALVVVEEEGLGV